MKYFSIFLLIMLTGYSSVAGQFFHKAEAKKNSHSLQNKKIWGKYEHSEFEDYQSITLYNNKDFYYKISGTAYSTFCVGKWHIKKDTLVLENEINSEDIPITIKYVRDSFKDTTGLIRRINKGPFLMPRNKKGELFRDAEVCINDSSIAYSPFFDTTFGNYRNIDSIRIDFGGYYYSQWIKVREKKGHKMVPVAQIDFLLLNYDATKLRRFKIRGSTLEAIRN